MCAQKGKTALHYVEDGEKRQKLLMMVDEAAQRLHTQSPVSEKYQCSDVSGENNGGGEQNWNLSPRARDSEVHSYFLCVS